MCLLLAWSVATHPHCPLFFIPNTAMPVKKLPFWKTPGHRGPMLGLFCSLLRSSTRLEDPIHTEYALYQVTNEFRQHRHNTSPTQCAELAKKGREVGGAWEEMSAPG
jgi:hypothetical protein